MNFIIEKIFFEECYLIKPSKFIDERGSFIKTFHETEFNDNNIRTVFKEEYYTRSVHGVLRGLHFQNPPKDLAKMIYCPVGEVLDVVVDIRAGSPTYGHHELINLSEENAYMIYIPPGFAHGFYVLSQSSIMIYKVSHVYDAGCDTGILWNSVGIPWPDDNPIMSNRDKELIKFENFKSLFKYKD